MAEFEKDEDTATSHSGWTSGDGRVYNNNVCRSAAGSVTTNYIVYTFGAALPAWAVVVGVRIYYHAGDTKGSTDGNDTYFQLTNGTTLVGNAWGLVDIETDISACSDAISGSVGSQSSLWGCTQTELKASNLGVACKMTVSTSGTKYVDGINIHIFYNYPNITRRASVTAYKITTEDKTRRAEVLAAFGKEETRRAEVSAVLGAEGTRRASVNVARMKGELESLYKTVGTTHSGWSSGDGRIYSNSTCRTLDTGLAMNYNVWGYGFSLPDEANVKGVEVEHHLDASGAGPTATLYLAEDTTQKGTGKSATVGTSSCGTSYESLGGLSDAWGMTSSALNYTVKHANFGILLYGNTTVGGRILNEDGFKITVYFEDNNNIRRAQVTAVEVKEEMRRSQVTHVAGKEETRRSEISAAVEAEDFRRAELLVAVTKEETREASLNIAVTKTPDPVRRAEVSPVEVNEFTRRAVVLAAFEKEESRRASLNIATTKEPVRRGSIDVQAAKEETRRSKLRVSPEQITRRSEVFVYTWWAYNHPTRRAMVYAELGTQDTRRAEVFACYLGDVTRRAEVTTATGREETRRALVDVDADYLIGDDERRAIVYAEPGAQDTRRAEVSVEFIGDITRRAEITVAAGVDITRRALVDVDADFFTGDDERRAVVSIPAWEPVRRAEVTVTGAAVTGDEERRATVAVPAWEPVRRAEVTVLTGIITGDEERRAVVAVPAWEPTRRAEVTVTVAELIGDGERRAQVTVTSGIGDVTRRAEIYAALQVEEIRRAVVLPVGNDVVRRASVTVESVYYTKQAVRRASVTVGISEDVRRASITVDSGGVVRRARVKAYVFWLYASETRRASVSITDAGEDTRRAKVFATLAGDVLRRAEVTAGLASEEVRRASVNTTAPADPARKATVEVGVGTRLRMTVNLTEK
jgi:hypothetical protein